MKRIVWFEHASAKKRDRGVSIVRQPRTIASRAVTSEQEIIVFGNEILRIRNVTGFIMRA